MDFFTLVGLVTCFYFLICCISLWFFDSDFHLAFANIFGKKLVRLKGKVIWITDASTVLGTMLALKAARYGGKLVLSSKSLKEVEKIKTLCLKFLKPKNILVLEFDLGLVTTHEHTLKKVIRYFGKLDILILNEDKWEKGAWEETSLSIDRHLFHSNVFGVISLSRLVVRYFNLKQNGKLAVASSIAGLVGVPYSGSYAATKHALHGYFNGLRVEKLGENIQITLLCLGSSELSAEKITSENEFIDIRGRARRSASGKKMSAKRCAHLCLTAIVNDLDEVWMAAFPILPLIYGIKYFPNITKTMLKYLKSTGV